MYVYILRCEDQSLYTGIASDIIKRIKQHLGILSGGAKYTRSHRVVYVETVWKLDSENAARKLEYRLKKLNHDQKENILKNPYKIVDEYSDILNEVMIENCDVSYYNEYFEFK